ncbi:MAG: hypothetical protein Q4E73_08530 [Lachnospiraceae bacterium]|nr:hypothetical protein [Lachnospiraceae bacterium]
MKNRGYTFLILVISWTCFVIGCSLTAAYLNVSSQYQSQTQSTETVQAMQVQEQAEKTAETGADDLRFASVMHFMESYYQNLKEGNRTQLMKMVEDPDSFYSDSDLRKIKAYVESYQNFEYYIEDTLEKQSYIVFTFYQTKLYDVDTLVPGMSQYYIVKDDDQWMIYNNTEHLSETAQKELKSSLRLRKIKQLIEETNAKYKKAIESDESLKEYFEGQK